MLGAYVQCPEVVGYGSCVVESFEDYLARWPQELQEFPRDLIESWVYRHWGQFKEEWMPQGALSWRYELREFSNPEVMGIQHFANDLKTMDYWGDQLLVDRQRQETWLAEFMLSHGTLPTPILVLTGSSGIVHPRAHEGEAMLLPFQIIEGHMRLAYLRGMIRNAYPKVRNEHQVWVANAGA